MTLRKAAGAARKCARARRGCRTAALAAACLSAAAALTPSLAVAQEQVPRYAVTITLSPAATRKIATSGEQIHVWAMYFGEARPGVKGDEMGQITFSAQDVDIPGAGTATLGGVTLSAGKLRQIKGRPQVLINVYTSRKVFPDNLLDCGIFQDDVRKAAPGIPIACKLIGER